MGCKYAGEPTDNSVWLDNEYLKGRKYCRECNGVYIRLSKAYPLKKYCPKYKERSKHMTLYEYLKQQEKKRKVLQDMNLDSLTQEQFGKIMHDPDIEDEYKSKLNDAVQESGGYECLARMD